MLDHTITDCSVHELFERQALQMPDQQALIYKQQSITYQSLNSRANGLAQKLINEGVTAGEVVALYMDRSPAMFIGMLAILKCGATYLPLDVTNPEARIQLYLDQAKVAFMVSDRILPDILARQAVVLSSSIDHALFTTEVVDNINVHVSRDAAAYIMFTSGSTGLPKGVVVPHRGITRLVKNTNYIEIESSDRSLQLSSLCFDASTFEIWGALLNGAALVIYPANGLDIKLLKEQIALHKVNVMWLTAALFHLLVGRFITIFDGLDTLLAGGDVLHSGAINKLLDEYPNLVLINGYGPTENTTFTCCHRMTNNNRPAGDVPIGAPITGTNIHVLDEHLTPVKLGEIGELYVSGDGVALGYLNDQRSNASFFTNGDVAGSLIYRTGDLVSQTEEGYLNFVGRTDNLLKIRGFRVSIEEVESGLLGHDQIIAAAVLANKDDASEHHLIAYVQLDKTADLSPLDVKKMLGQTLPDYMVPNIVHVVEKLPINANGKIDRAQLRNGKFG